MIIKYYTKDLIEMGEDPSELLEEKVPGAEDQFVKLCKQLKSLQKKINKVFPDTNYYHNSSGLGLMLGKTHDGHKEDDSDNQEYVNVLGGDIGLSDGGDW